MLSALYIINISLFYQYDTIKDMKTKRCFLPQREQRRFIERILSEMTLSEAARICNLSKRSISDWRRGVLSMDYEAIRKLCKMTRIPIPKNLEIRERYWYASKGGRESGKITRSLYKGKMPEVDEEYRKKRWYEWWNQEGRYKKHPIINSSSPVKKPLYSEELAECVGIILGDGGITRSQVTITLHKYDDIEYSEFVIQTFKSLFDVMMSIRPKKYKNYKAIDYVISRRELVKYLTSDLGLKIGNKVKQQIDVPQWIKKKQSYKIACARGLMDTDGSVFLHRYKVCGKEYKYKKISFSNYSLPLVMFMFDVFQEVGLNPRIARSSKEVRIDAIEDIKKYFSVVGSHNSKHLKKWEK